VDEAMVQQMWDSIAIVGQKDDGTPYKNWIQDMVRSAIDFEGSFTQSVVGGTAIVDSDAAGAIAAATADALAGAAPALVEPAPAADPAPQVAPVAQAATPAVDPLAGLI